MDRMKKMLMMDSRTFNRLTTPKDKVLSSIEGEMSSILNDESIPEDVRAKRYASTQSRYLKIEHPQWGETTTKKNPPNAMLDNTFQNLAWRGRPLSSILKNPKRMSVIDKNVSSMESEDVPELGEIELWTPSDFLERSSTGEYSGPPLYGTVKTPNVNDKDSLMTPDDFLRNPTSESEKLQRGRYTSEPQIYVTPGFPNTRGRKKIKFETLYK